MQIRIRRSERACFFGRTGSGKTTLARSLLRSTNAPHVVLDPKHRYVDADTPIVREFDKRLDAQIIRVPVDQSELETWDEQVWRIWKAGDRIIYADELTLLLYGPRTLIPEAARAIRTGRERRVAFWSGSQRPSDIPSVVFTEAEHFFLFRLQFENDRYKVASFTTEGVMGAYRRLHKEGRKVKHDFLYYGVDDDRLVRFRATRPPARVAAVPLAR